MAYNAIVTRLKNVRPHSNADKVQLATCHGNQVVVGLDSLENHLGVYFPSDGQLSHEFCYANDLYRDATMNKDPKSKPGMFDNNRRVRTQKFRGEISDGFWVPLHLFGFISVTGLDVEGFEFDTWKKIPICSKYVNPATVKVAHEANVKKTKTSKKSIMFKEHFDTGQFGQNIHQFTEDATIYFSEKLHGTSGRVGYVQLERDLSLIEKLAKLVGVKVKESDWKYMSGTRRTVAGESIGVPFHEPTIREKALKLFEGNLRKGESVYFEIVGFEYTGAPIMGTVSTEKLNDKEFTKRYGKTITYKYGCEPNQSEVYVYRMTMTNEDGQSIDYSFDDVVKRTKEIGVKMVPFLCKTSMREIDLISKIKSGNNNFDYDEENAKSELQKLATLYASGSSTLDSEHIKEGVVIRIENGFNNRSYKFKSFEFKVLEGILKDTGFIDAEESQG